MKRYSTAILLVALAGGMFLAGAWYGQRNSVPGTRSGGRKVLYYVDPMNPAHTSREPGLAPCGMKMEPVYAGDSPGLTLGSDSSPLPAGTVNLSLEKQHLVGVQVAEAKRMSFQHTLRWLGKVAVDETRIYRINASLGGRITKALPYGTGSPVKKDDLLAAYYSPDFLQAAQILVFGLNAEDQMRATKRGAAVLTNQPPQSVFADRTAQFTYADQLSGFANADQLSQSQRTIKLNIEALKNFGMGDLQLEELIRARKPLDRIDLTAPADGFILTRNVSVGQSFEKGAELFRMADLSKVWIVATVFANDADYIRPGLLVRVALAHQQKVFSAVVSQVPPQFDGVSRTLQVRLEADNPDLALKPEMLVDLEVPITLPETVMVSADAVLDSGRNKAVFVDRGHGIFEPRPVETGRRWGDQVEIIQGLAAGERFVTAGNFLVDSESRMKLAAAGLHGTPARDPVCGMMVDEPKALAAKRFSEYLGKTYCFCNDACKQSFDQTPARFTEKPGQSPAAPAEPLRAAASSATSASDPVCGMSVDPQKAREAKRLSEHQGATYYFCNIACKRSFDADPASFLKGAAQRPAEPSPAPVRASPEPAHH